MSEKLLTRNVFVDTSIFVGANFGVDAGVFRALVELCQAGSVRLVLTDITLHEVDTRLSVAVSDADTSLRHARSKARVLRNVQWPELAGVFADLDKEKVTEELRGKIREFVRTSDAEILAATHGDPRAIFDDYFAKRPPFGDGKKKSEFPDAFVAAALSNLCSPRGDHIYVVSSDGDLRAACDTSERLHHLSSLATFVDLVLADDRLVKLAHERLARHRSSIQREITSEFEGLWMFLDDVDGEATSISVGDLLLEDEAVISVGRSDASISAVAKVSFSAEITYKDPDSWYCDSEDKQVYYRNTIDTTIERDGEVPVEFTLRFDEDDPDYYAVEKVKLNKGEALSTYADDDAASSYK